MLSVCSDILLVPKTEGDQYSSSIGNCGGWFDKESGATGCIHRRSGISECHGKLEETLRKSIMLMENYNLKNCQQVHTHSCLPV